MTTYALFNLGRDKKPGSTDRIDWRMLTLLYNNVPHTDCVIFFVEVNEGDDNNEMALIRQRFPGWRIYGQGTREPILMSPDIPRAKADVRKIPFTAVRKWSPQRTLLRVRRTDRNETYFGVHYAAGANGQGDRPKWAIPLLNISWRRTERVHLAAKKAEHAGGGNVVEMLDRNAYTLDPLPGEKVVDHHRTDWGTVWAARGWVARFKGLSPVDVDLDSHDIRRMRGGFTERNAA